MQFTLENAMQGLFKNSSLQEKAVCSKGKAYLSIQEILVAWKLLSKICCKALFLYCLVLLKVYYKEMTVQVKIGFCKWKNIS